MASIKQKLNNLYQKLCATKIHLWAHLFGLLGWIYIFNYISFLFDCNKDIFSLLIGIAALTYYLILPIVVFSFLEIILLDKFKIKWTLLTKNNFYNIIWLLGVITSFYTWVILLFISINY